MSYEYEKQIKDDLKALHEMRKFAEWRAVEMNIDDKYAELDHVYVQATKADEYEAKAKAYDRIVEERNRIGKLMHNKEYPQVFTDEAFWNIDDIIIDAEGGEPNAKK